MHCSRHAHTPSECHIIVRVLRTSRTSMVAHCIDCIICHRRQSYRQQRGDKNSNLSMQRSIHHRVLTSAASTQIHNCVDVWLLFHSIDFLSASCIKIYATNKNLVTHSVACKFQHPNGLRGPMTGNYNVRCTLQTHRDSTSLASGRACIVILCVRFSVNMYM